MTTVQYMEQAADISGHIRPVCHHDAHVVALFPWLLQCARNLVPADTVAETE